MTTSVESFGQTDVGRRRQLNEDSYFLDDALGLYVVADGMGGQNAGEVASKIAIDAVSTFIRRSKDSEITWPFGIVSHYSYNANRLRTAVMLANRRVWRDAETRQDYVGMGTTIVAVLVENDVVSICSAGDSRAYRIRENHIEQVTTDDSWVQAALSIGALGEEEIEDHPMRSIVTKAIGAKETIDVDVLETAICGGDVYLLCTDGLHGMVPDTRILEAVVSANGDIQKTAADLVASANAAGGKDNITVLLVRSRSA